MEYVDGDYRVVVHESGAVERILMGPSAPVDLVPPEVTAAQAITAIANAGRLGDLMAWVETLPPLERVQFERVQTFSLNSPLLNAGAAALGITEEEKAALFEAARHVVI